MKNRKRKQDDFQTVTSKHQVLNSFWTELEPRSPYKKKFMVNSIKKI